MSQSTIELIPELSSQKFQEKKQQYFSNFRPRFLGAINIYQDYLILSHEGRDWPFQINVQSRESWKKLFSMMDGTKTLSELQAIFLPNNPEGINTLLHRLDEQGFLDDVASVSVEAGIDTLLELEDLTEKLFDRAREKNLFWQAIQATNSSLPINVLYGFAIESYHLFCRQDCFISPILNFQASAKIRQLVNEFYCQEYGRDKLLLKALATIDINREDLEEAIPLSSTMAIYNGLAYWSNFEPYFFLSILGILTKQIHSNFELYLKACERVSLSSEFITPIKQLTNIQRQQELGSLAHHIFQAIPHLDRNTRQRFQRQIHILIEMSDSFHTAIWNYYSSTERLIRRVSAI